MDIYRTEEEQVEAIKRALREYGTWVALAAVLAVAAVLGWRWYQQEQQAAVQAASGLYQDMLTAAGGAQAGNADDAARVAAAGAELVEKYGDTTYAQFARLLLASQAVDGDDLPKAAEQLRAVVDGGSDDGLAAIAADRLARVLMAQGRNEEALKVLDAEVPAEMAATREETRGDVLLDMGKRAEAKAAYLKAKELSAGEQNLGLLAVKLDYLAAD